MIIASGAHLVATFAKVWNDGAMGTHTRKPHCALRLAMAALRNSLYRNLLRTFRQFTHHGLPCHGLVVQAASSEHLAAALQSYQQLHASNDLEEQVRCAFRGIHPMQQHVAVDGLHKMHTEPASSGQQQGVPPGQHNPSELSLDHALQALRCLQAQLSVLQGAEPATRAAILRWQQLLLHHAPSSTKRSADADPSATSASTADRNPVPRTQPSSSGSSRVATPLAWTTVEQQILQYAAAAEEAAFTLFEISHLAASSDGEDSDDPLLSLSVEESDGEGQEGEQQVGLTSREGAVKALDALAQQAAEASRRMEQEQRRSSAPQQTATSTSTAAAAMQGVASVLLQSRSRLRCDAIEWVYDGLGPLLLPDVLRRRKGVPLSLAIACSRWAWSQEQRAGKHSVRSALALAFWGM